MITKKQVEESAAYLRSRLSFVPEVGLVLGSGLGPLAGQLQDTVTIAYAEIPHFRISSAVCLQAGVLFACRDGCTAMKAMRRMKLRIRCMSCARWACGRSF